MNQKLAHQKCVQRSASSPCKRCTQVKGDLETVYELKSVLKSSVRKEGFKYLLECQKDKSKIKDIKYSSLKLQEYLGCQRPTTIKEKCLLFKARTRMLDLKSNFKLGQTDLSCSRCGTGEESQRHVLSCPAVMQGDTSLVSETSCYEDLLGEDPDRVETLGKILNKNFDVFEKLPCDRRNVSAVSATGAT